MAKRSYAENAQTIFSIFDKKCAQQIWLACTVNVIVMFLVIILKKVLFINYLFKCGA